MNRRNFISGLFNILPAATCYKRIWHEVAKIPVAPVINPEWVKLGPEANVYFTWAAEAWPSMKRGSELIYIPEVEFIDSITPKETEYVQFHSKHYTIS